MLVELVETIEPRQRLSIGVVGSRLMEVAVTEQIRNRTRTYVPVCFGRDGFPVLLVVARIVEAHREAAEISRVLGDRTLVAGCAALVDQGCVEILVRQPNDGRPHKARSSRAEAPAVELILEPAGIIVVISRDLGAELTADRAFH